MSTYTVQVQLASSPEEISSCFNVMHQLRPHITDSQAFVSQIERQTKDGYKLAYIAAAGTVKAVMGFRFLEFLAWGKILYIDDLITDIETRRSGLASQLLNWVIEQAKQANCAQVHLDSSHHRYEAHRLYLNHGFNITGHHFSLKL